MKTLPGAIEILQLVPSATLVNESAMAQRRGHKHGHGHGPILRVGFSYGFPIDAPRYLSAPLYTFPGYALPEPGYTDSPAVIGYSPSPVYLKGTLLRRNPRRPRVKTTGTTAPVPGRITPMPRNVPVVGSACRHKRPRAKESEHLVMCNRLRFSPLVAHARPLGMTATVYAKHQRGGRLLVATELLSGYRALAGPRPGCAGGSGEIRTRDQRIKSPLFYRLSYQPPFEEGRMLATTPPPVKPQPRVYAVLPAAEALAPIVANQLRKPRSISGVMAVEALKSKCGGRLGAGRLQRKIVA